MGDARWPPQRSCLFRVKLLGDTGNDLVAVVWVGDLLPWFDKFDIGLGQYATVGLLETPKGLLVVTPQNAFVSDWKHCLRIRSDAHRQHILVRCPFAFPATVKGERTALVRVFKELYALRRLT